MTKKIVLTSCEGCPHKDHRGGYGNPSYVPVCRNVNKNLGFKREVNSRGTGVTAVYDGKIPSWCPLEENTSPEVEALLVWAESRFYLFDTQEEQNELEKRLRSLKGGTPNE